MLAPGDDNTTSDVVEGTPKEEKEQVESSGTAASDDSSEDQQAEDKTSKDTSTTLESDSSPSSSPAMEKIDENEVVQTTATTVDEQQPSRSTSSNSSMMDNMVSPDRATRIFGRNILGNIIYNECDNCFHRGFRGTLYVGCFAIGFNSTNFFGIEQCKVIIKLKDITSITHLQGDGLCVKTYDKKANSRYKYEFDRLGDKREDLFNLLVNLYDDIDFSASISQLNASGLNISPNSLVIERAEDAGGDKKRTSKKRISFVVEDLKKSIDNVQNGGLDSASYTLPSMQTTTVQATQRNSSSSMDTGMAKEQHSPRRATITRAVSAPIEENREDITGPDGQVREATESDYLSACAAAAMADFSKSTRNLMTEMKTGKISESGITAAEKKWGKDVIPEDLAQGWIDFRNRDDDIKFTNVVVDNVPIDGCTLDEFFKLFLCDVAPCSMGLFQTNNGDKDVETTIWKLSDEDNFTLTRKITYSHPVNAPMAPPEAAATKQQFFKRYGEHGISLESKTFVNDVPLTDCFYVHDQLLLEPRPDEEGLYVSFRFEVVFVKNTMFRKIIQNTTKTEVTRDMKKFCNTYIMESLKKEKVAAGGGEEELQVGATTIVKAGKGIAIETSKEGKAAIEVTAEASMKRPKPSKRRSVAYVKTTKGDVLEVEEEESTVTLLRNNNIQTIILVLIFWMVIISQIYLTKQIGKLNTTVEQLHANQKELLQQIEANNIRNKKIAEMTCGDDTNEE